MSLQKGYEIKWIKQIKYVLLIDSNLANNHQVENYDINLKYGIEKFLSKSLLFNSKSAKMVIYDQIHKMSSFIELTKTMGCILNSQVNHSIFVVNLVSAPFGHHFSTF